MGVAAYWRGSRAISTQFQREAYQAGRSPFNPDAAPAKPTPRPANYGDKATQKAVNMVRHHLEGARKMAALQGDTFDPHAVLQNLAVYLWADRGIPKATAARAVEIVAAELRVKANPRGSFTRKRNPAKKAPAGWPVQVVEVHTGYDYDALSGPFMETDRAGIVLIDGRAVNVPPVTWVRYRAPGTKYLGNRQVYAEDSMPWRSGPPPRVGDTITVARYPKFPTR